MEVLYMQFESERIEYKSQIIDDIYHNPSVQGGAEHEQ